MKNPSKQELIIDDKGIDEFYRQKFIKTFVEIKNFEKHLKFTTIIFFLMTFIIFMIFNHFTIIIFVPTVLFIINSFFVIPAVGKKIISLNKKYLSCIAHQEIVKANKTS